MKIGIFGGAFNPVHNGHLQLMNSYLDALMLDKIILIPTAVPPHKTAEQLISGEDRLNMVSLAVKGNDRLEVSDIEFRREGKSYTYITVCELKKLYAEDELFLIVGSDQFLYFPNWYQSEELLKLVTVCTSARNQGEYKALLDFKNDNENMQHCIVSDFEVFEVSSSEIREKIKNKDSISGLVPTAVEEYIKEHRLYG